MAGACSCCLPCRPIGPASVSKQPKNHELYFKIVHKGKAWRGNEILISNKFRETLTKYFWGCFCCDQIVLSEGKGKSFYHIQIVCVVSI